MIELIFQNNTACVYNVEGNTYYQTIQQRKQVVYVADWKILRSKYRIIGEMIGSTQFIPCKFLIVLFLFVLCLNFNSITSNVVA